MASFFLMNRQPNRYFLMLRALTFFIQNEFTFTVKRNFNFYMMMIIVPSFTLTFICMAGFFTSNLEIDDSVKVANKKIDIRK